MPATTTGTARSMSAPSTTSATSVLSLTLVAYTNGAYMYMYSTSSLMYAYENLQICETTMYMYMKFRVLVKVYLSEN